MHRSNLNGKTLSAALTVAVSITGATLAEGLGVVYVTPDASRSDVAGLIDGQSFETVMYKPGLDVSGSASGILLHPSDLDDPDVLGFAQAVYAAGETVAIVDVTPAEAVEMAHGVGFAAPQMLSFGLDEVERYVAIRSDADRGRFLHRMHLMGDGPPALDTTDDAVRTAEANWSAYLTWTFSAQAIEANPLEDVENDLTQLADCYQNSDFVTASGGRQVGVVNNVWCGRSFSGNDLDYYYLEQTITCNYVANCGAGVCYAENTLTSPAVEIAPQTPKVVQSSPGNAQNATTYTSGVTMKIGGMAGYTKGSVLLVSGEVTISNSTSITVPATNIDFSGANTGEANWEYGLQPQDDTLFGGTYQYTQHVIWSVPFAAYDVQQTSLSFRTDYGATWFVQHESNPVVCADAKLNTSVPIPFNDFLLSAPVIDYVCRQPDADDCSDVAAIGDTISIYGAHFYEIESVFIGGFEVPSSSYSVCESDTKLCLQIPPGTPEGDEPVQVSSSIDVSNSDKTVTITSSADLDRDGCVDWQDLMMLLADFGSGCDGCASDIDGDGDVDSADLIQLLDEFGGC